MPRKLKQPSPPGPDDLLRLLAELKFSTLATELHEVLRWAGAEQPDFTTFLARALTIERDGRKERRLERLLRRARLRTAPLLDDFNFSIRAKLSGRAIKELGRCRFVDEGRNVLCLGKSSTGKTHIAKAIGRNACLLGKKTYFTVASELLDELIAAEEEGTFRRLWKRYVRCDLLILDEAGYAPFDKRHANLLF
ncbi:ATP-binding protein, partial [Planctomycetota bacterium]